MTGRPRDPDLERRLLAAGWELLTAAGYDALSLSQVASRAGAHRSDVYRRWPTKAQLVVDVLAAHLPPVRPRDTGSLRGDLRAHVGDLAAAWSASWVDGLVGAMADLRLDPDAELAFAELAQSRGRGLREALDRAAGRGEVGELPTVLTVSALAEGPLMHQRLIARRPLDDDFLDAVTEQVHELLTRTATTSGPAS